ncbi:hypothetical protein [Zunongwangia endophytica]|uniref:Uncharacterized protein n=1 Tax=Zunongwangia endophytica TaxID=1808945 RepID=A0ABV8H5S1_9FLAO|nr:hypothetical protein [Zunongwangia endophytica]MDN3595318.1 hypothetical protein [Zunongwangia endophytica]
MANITTKDTHFDKVYGSFLDNTIQLSDFQEKMKNRVKTAFTLMLDRKTRDQVSKILQDQFEVSQATAYRDIGNALKIYGDVGKADKEGMRFLIFEYNQQALDIAFKEKNLAEIGKGLDRMIKLADFDGDDKLVNLDKIKNMDITITLDTQSKKGIDKIVSGGVVDLNDFEAEDTDFEELKEEEDEE